MGLWAKSGWFIIRAMDAQPQNFSSQTLDFLKEELGFTTYQIVKSKNRCFVLETPDCFYKIKEFDPKDPFVYFDHILNVAFAEELRQMGLNWEFSTLKVKWSDNNADKSFAIERRQKLAILNQKECSLNEALVESSKVTRRVELNLGFPNLQAQIRQLPKFDRVSRICLMRDDDLRYEDFACLNGDVVCLGSSNRFLGMCDEDGNWFDLTENIGKMVRLNFETCFFASRKEYSTTEESRCFHSSCDGFWWIYSEEFGSEMLMAAERKADELEKMNVVNLKILTEKRPFSVFCEASPSNCHDDRIGF